MLKQKKVACVALGFLTIAIAVSCASKTVATTSKANQPIKSAENTQNANENLKALMTKGEEIYRTKCTHCHGVPETSAYSSNRWDRIINEMAPRARLDAAEKNAVLTYVKAGAR